MIPRKSLIIGVVTGIVTTICIIFNFQLLKKYDPECKFVPQKHIFLLPQATRAF